MFAAGSDMTQIPNEVRTYIASSNIQQRVKMNLNIMLFFHCFTLPARHQFVLFHTLRHHSVADCEGLEKVLSLNCQTPFLFLYVSVPCCWAQRSASSKLIASRCREKFIDFSIIIFHQLAVCHLHTTSVTRWAKLDFSCVWFPHENLKR